MSLGSGGADESPGQGEFEISPVGPEAFSENTQSETEDVIWWPKDDQGLEPLSDNEELVWLDTMESFDESLYPPLEELNDLNSCLVGQIRDMYKEPKSKVDRQEADDDLKGIEREILGNLQEVLTDMNDPAIVSKDQFTRYAADLIFDHTVARVVSLNQALGDEFDEYIPIPKFKKLQRKVVSWVEHAPESELPGGLVELYEAMLDNDMAYVRRVLKEAYRDHDFEKIGQDLARITLLLERIADNTSPDRQGQPQAKSPAPPSEAPGDRSQSVGPQV